MPRQILTASEEFRKLYQELLRRQSRVIDAMQQHSARYFSMKHVVGFGAGRRWGRFAPVFLVDRKIPLSQLAPRDRAPRWIKIGGQRLRTEVIAVGTPSNFADPVGDPTDNDQSYRVDGKGEWKMGTKIQIFANHGKDVKSGGTAGARVLAKAGEPPLLLSCAHVLKNKGWDVAQADENRDIPKPLHNFVGGVKQVLDGRIDAGVAECAGALKEILHIGPPKAPQKPLVGMHVQKSGAATGLTYGTIVQVGLKKANIKGKWAEQDGVFTVANSCRQDPRAPGKLPVGAPANPFAWHGDSGSLIVLGMPNNSGSFGTADLGLQHKYDTASDAEKKKIVDENYCAALGLLIAGADDVVYGQDIALALGALKVQLDI